MSQAEQLTRQIESQTGDMAQTMGDLRVSVEAGALEQMTPDERLKLVLKLLDHVDSLNSAMRTMALGD